MSVFQAIALYDFSTNVRGELSFTANDIVAVTSVDVGGGWWEARNFDGVVGLVPSSYFKVKPEIRLKLNPVLSSPQRSTSSSSTSSSTHSIYLPPRPPPKPARLKISPPSIHSDSISPSNSEQDSKMNSNNCSVTRQNSSHNVEDTAYDFDDFGDDDDYDDDMEEFKLNKLIGLMTGSTDLYLFDTNPHPLPEDVRRVCIIDTTEGPVWLSASLPISCKVGSPRKEKKFKGIKSFTTYQITPSNTSVSVYRRYKQFDWLHAQLSRKFLTLLIPPLPNKQISGRFEEEFINARLKQLEMWLLRMCKHPVISQSEVLKLFLNCKGVEEWKSGKRLAEKDKFRGACFYHTVQPPDVILDPISVELELDKFERFVRCVDDSIKHLLGVCQKVSNCYKCKLRKEFCKLGKSFDNLSKSFELDARTESKRLTSALSYTGKTYNEVGMLFGVQPSRDSDNLVECLAQYKGILSAFPDIMLVQRSTTNKIQETAGQLSRQDVNKVQGRANVITYTLLAEMHHFQVNRVSDFSRMMQNYLKAQIEFSKQVTSKFEQALKHYGGLS